MAAKAKDVNVPVAKPTNTAEVDKYMAVLDHPLKEMAEELRQIILAAHKAVGEEIAWNAPSFFYTGVLMPFKPKEYKRFIVGFNFFKKDCIRLVFLRGALADNTAGMLGGDYADGRRLAMFYTPADVRKRKKDLQKIVKELLLLIEKEG